MSPLSSSTSCGNQDRRFFHDAFERYFARIVDYIYSYYPDRETAKNIAQDTFMVLWENLHKIDTDATPLPYLLFIAKNKALNALKRDIVKRKYTNYTVKRELEINYKALESSTLDAVFFREAETLIGKGCGHMNRKVRETFYLSRYKYLKNEEIAKELNVSVKTVEYRMMSALRILRKYLKDFIQIIISFFTFISFN